ncbi:MAG: hypothetical protein M3115_03350 [Thermoproteota archaeon]|nr:hypothetical protein [Thermoproteota archaeon]
MGESKTHRDINLALAESLKQFFVYKIQIERHFEGRRIDAFLLQITFIAQIQKTRRKNKEGKEVLLI